MLKVVSHTNTLFTSISYILIDEDPRDCWIIDVGDYEDIKQLISGYNLRGVLLTYVHYDHIYGLNHLLVDYPTVPVYTNACGQKSIYSPSDNLSAYHDDNFVLASDNVMVVKEGETIRMGEDTLDVFENPGHDYSCITFRLGYYLFTGDAHIPGVKVYTKLQNGSKKDAEKSTDRILTMLAEGLNVLPGHFLQ